MINSIHINVNGYNLHLLEAGTGSPVLLLHGLAVSAEDWRPTIELLSRSGYRAIAVDALGFGKSDKPRSADYNLQLFADLYAGLLDKLGIEQATFVGHSMGGKFTLATAVLHPRRIKRLVIIDSEGFLKIPYYMRRAGKIPKLGETIFALSANRTMMRNQLQLFFHDPRRYVTPDLVERGLAVLGDIEIRRTMVSFSRQYDNLDLEITGLRARLGELRCPTLVIWGKEDRVFAPSGGEAARREIPNARLVFIEQCGHFPQIEAERAFYGLLLGFLAAGEAEIQWGQPAEKTLGQE